MEVNEKNKKNSSVNLQVTFYEDYLWKFVACLNFQQFNV